MKKNIKLNRIKRMLKKYPDVSGYLLNKYSRKVYTNTDLDILEELLKKGFFKGAFLDNWYNGAIQLYDKSGIVIEGKFRNIQSNKRRWNGLYHFTAIRKALHNMKLAFAYAFKGEYHFYVNDDFNYIIDVNKRQINWWPKEGEADLEKFKKSIEDVMSSIVFRRSKDEFKYELIENPDELLLGMDIVATSSATSDPYLNWGPETMTLVEYEGEVGDEPAKIIDLRRDDVSITFGVIKEDGLHVNCPEEFRNSIAELWHRKGHDTIIWVEDVPEIIVEEINEEDISY